jgi:MFS family permease
VSVPSQTPASLRANPPKLYAYKFLSEFFLIVPVLIPYYVFNRLSATQIFTVQAAYHVGVLLLEIPSGYLADVVGRKRTLVLAGLFLPLGMALYAFTGSFTTFVLAEFSIAVGNSLRSGSDSALMFDTLILLHREGEYRKFEGRSFLFTRLGTAGASLAGGLLALIALRLPFYVNVATYVLILPVVVGIVEPERTRRRAANPLLDIFHIAGRCFQHPRLRRLMMMGGLVQSASVIGVWAYFLYFKSLGINLAVVGALFAAFQLASALGSSQAFRLSHRIGEKASFLLLLLIGGVFLALGAVSARPLVALVVPAAWLWGFGWPVFMDSFNRLTTSEIRATVLSVASMCASVSFVVLSPLFGRLVDVVGLSRALLVLGLFYLLAGSAILAGLFRVRTPAELVG